MPGADALGEAVDWLRFAEDDLGAAKLGLQNRPQIQPRHVCFDAQQAAEKAIKAICLAEAVTFPYTHDLPRLADLLAPAARPSATAEQLQELTLWATAQRYPGDDEAEWPDAERAVEVAETVVADARANVSAA